MTLVGEESDVYGFVLVEQERRGTLGTLIIRCEDNIKMNLKEIELEEVGSINLTGIGTSCYIRA